MLPTLATATQRLCKAHVCNGIYYPQNSNSDIYPMETSLMFFFRASCEKSTPTTLTLQRWSLESPLQWADFTAGIGPQDNVFRHSEPSHVCNGPYLLYICCPSFFSNHYVTFHCWNIFVLPKWKFETHIKPNMWLCSLICSYIIICMPVVKHHHNPSQPFRIPSLKALRSHEASQQGANSRNPIRTPSKGPGFIAESCWLVSWWVSGPLIEKLY